MMTKESFKKALVGLGIVSVVAGGIAYYFSQETQEKDYLTYEEYVALIKVYDQKLKEIKADCDKDVRCVRKGKPYVRFENVKNKKDIVERLNRWIEKEKKDPKAYKK